MITNKKRVQNIDSYISHIKDGEKFIVGLTHLEQYKDKIRQIGFPDHISNGQSILPSGIFGPVSRYNSEGKENIHKDLPKETAYRQSEWHWTEWHGPYDRVEQSKIVDIPYERYPRSYVAPPSVEFIITEKGNGELLIIGPILEKIPASKGSITHVVNLFLEIFGECQFFSEDLDSLTKTSFPSIRLNWEILPQGRIPWEQLHNQLKTLIEEAPKGNQVVIEHRLEVVTDLHPEFTAVGRGGFHGYIIHGFPNKSIFILESMYYGNATYVFGDKWEDLSKLTKAEILNEKLQKDRVVHREGWEEKIKGIIKKN